MGCQQLTYKKANFLKVVHSKNDKTTSKNVLSSYRYSFQGQEKDAETGKVAFELRLYDPRINRWLTTDPEGQYHSPYMAMGNNPVSRVDPDGGEDNPVYGANGEGFLGTTESGLQGEAIIMDAANFTQGMSDASALNVGTLFSNLNSLQNFKFMGSDYGHWKGLSFRPDWDGIVTIDEGVNWALAHPNSNGNPTDALYLNTAELDFGSVSTSDFSFEGQVRRVNLLYKGNPLNEAQRRTTYALGNTRLKLVSMDAKTIRVMNDAYDWNYHNGSSIKSKVRDGLIWGERQRTGINDTHGIPIRTYGLGTLRN